MARPVLPLGTVLRRVSGSVTSLHHVHSVREPEGDSLSVPELLLRARLGTGLPKSEKSETPCLSGAHRLPGKEICNQHTHNPNVRDRVPHSTEGAGSRVWGSKGKQICVGFLEEAPFWLRLER